jgi:hypothetical protein
MDERDSNGKVKPVRVGLAPEQGKGIEYEFDLLLELTTEHYANVIKDRTGRFQDRMIEKPGEEFGQELVAWLSDGAPAPERIVVPVVSGATVETPPATVAIPAGAPEWWEALTLLIKYNDGVEWMDLMPVIGASESTQDKAGFERPKASDIQRYIDNQMADGKVIDDILPGLVGLAREMKGAE